MAKAEDITKSEVYQRVVQDQIKKPSKFEQVIDIFGQFKNLVDNKVSSNIENLQGKGVFDKTRAVSFLEKIDGINQKYEDIDNNYGGSTKAYARAELKKNYNAELTSRIPAGVMKDNSILNISRPDAFYGEDFERQVTERAKIYDDNRLTFRQVAEKYNTGEGGAEELVSQLENDLKRATKVTGLDLITNFGNKDYYKTAFTGEGLLEKIESDNIYEKDISTIDSVNAKFKSLYRDSPAAAAKFEELVKDIRIDEEKTVIKTSINEEEREDPVTGQKKIVTVADFITTYFDANGKKQTQITRELVPGASTKNIETDLNNRYIYEAALKSKAHLEYNNYLQKGYTPRKAFEIISSDNKKSYTQINNEKLREQVMPNILEAFEKHKKAFYFKETADTGLFKTTQLKEDVEKYIEYIQTGSYEGKDKGKNPPVKPAFYYDNVEEFIADNYPQYAKFNEVSKISFNLDSGGLILNSSLDDSPKFKRTFEEFSQPGKAYDMLIRRIVPDVSVDPKTLPRENFIKNSNVYVNPDTVAYSGKVLNDELRTLKFNPKESYNIGYNFDNNTLEAISTGEFEPEIIFQDSRALGEMSPASRKLVAETKAKINTLTERRKRNTEKLKLIEEGKTTGPARKGSNKSTLLKRNEELNKEIEGLIDTVNRLEVPIKPAGITVETP